MSSKLGAVKYGTSDAEPFLGRDYGHQRDYSEDIAADIDSEVRDLIEAAHDEAWEILVQYRDVLDAMVLELVEKETLAKDDLERILAPVRKRPPHNTFSGFGKRTPSDRPPIEIPPSARSNGVSVNGGGSPALPGVQPKPDAAAPVSPSPSPAPSPAPAPPSSGQDFGPTQTYGSPQAYGEHEDQQSTAYLPPVTPPPPAPYPTYPERRHQAGTDGTQGSA
jgi:cell division protease FtsH